MSADLPIPGVLELRPKIHPERVIVQHLQADGSTIGTVQALIGLALSSLRNADTDLNDTETLRELIAAGIGSVLVGADLSLQAAVAFRKNAERMIEKLRTAS
jgi:hypothetical protein